MTPSSPFLMEFAEKGPLSQDGGLLWAHGPQTPDRHVKRGRLGGHDGGSWMQSRDSVGRARETQEAARRRSVSLVVVVVLLRHTQRAAVVVWLSVACRLGGSLLKCTGPCPVPQVAIQNLAPGQSLLRLSTGATKPANCQTARLPNCQTDNTHAKICSCQETQGSSIPLIVLIWYGPPPRSSAPAQNKTDSTSQARQLYRGRRLTDSTSVFKTSPSTLVEVFRSFFCLELLLRSEGAPRVTEPRSRRLRVPRFLISTASHESNRFPTTLGH